MALKGKGLPWNENGMEAHVLMHFRLLHAVSTKHKADKDDVIAMFDLYSLPRKRKKKRQNNWVNWLTDQSVRGVREVLEAKLRERS